MMYKDYIKIKQLILLYSFYGESVVVAEYDSMWESRALRLLDAMCELSEQGKFPESASLDTLIDFINKNPEASMLRKYIEHVHVNYADGNPVTIKDYEVHAFIIHCLEGFRYRNQKKLNDVYFNDNPFSTDVKNINNSNQLIIKTGSLIIGIEKENIKSPHLFTINNKKAPYIKIGELINLINYGDIVKNPNIINTQAAYYFLR